MCVKPGRLKSRRQEYGSFASSGTTKARSIGRIDLSPQGRRRVLRRSKGCGIIKTITPHSLATASLRTHLSVGLQWRRTLRGLSNTRPVAVLWKRAHTPGVRPAPVTDGWGVHCWSSSLLRLPQGRWNTYHTAPGHIGIGWWASSRTASSATQRRREHPFGRRAGLQ